MKIENEILSKGFYVRINNCYVATVRDMMSFEIYVGMENHQIDDTFGEIQEVDSSASEQFVNRLNEIISEVRKSLFNKKYKVGKYISVHRNQGYRDATVLFVCAKSELLLIEYSMPKGTTALNWINSADDKNYSCMTYKELERSSLEIDERLLIKNPQR